MRGTESSHAHTTCIPAERRASPRASIEPRASPSGRTWATMVQLRARSISLAARISFGFGLGLSAHTIEQLQNAGAPLQRGVNAKVQLRDAPHPQGPPQLTPDMAACAGED